MPLYGWLPYAARQRLRVKRQGPEIVASAGIDFHQFTYPGLRRTLRRTGFRRVVDLYEVLEPAELNHPTATRVQVMRAYKRLPPLKWALTTFASGSYFFCVE